MFRSGNVVSVNETSAAAAEQRLIEAAVALIRGARQRVVTIGGQASMLADRVFGPVPQPVSGGGAKSAEPNTAQAALESELRELHEAIEYLDTNVSRLERIA